MNKSIGKNVETFIKEKYDISSLEDLKVLGDNENLVFSVKDKVFRLTHFVHRLEEEIDTELNLLQILFKNGCSVVEIITSINGNNFEINTESEIYVTAFQKAKGEIINIADFGDKDEIIKEWGRTMGQIHRTICSNYKSINFKNRLEWDNEIIISKANVLLSSEDHFVLQELNAIIQGFTNLHKDKEEYGLVHTDMRPRNFHYNDGQITHFDFDDISNNWYIYDLAVAAFHETEAFFTKEERTKFIKNFLKHFLKGYLEEKKVDGIYFDYFIDFMKMRLIYAYIDYYKRLKIKGVDSGKGKMLGRREFIESFDNFINVSEIEKLLYSFKIN